MSVDKENILKRVIKIEDKLLVSKVLDKAAKCESIKKTVYSDFLDPYQKNVIEKALAGSKALNFTFYGGYEGAERVVIIFRPNFIFEHYDRSEDEYEDEYIEAPFKLLNIKVNSREALSHRDYLGSIMALGIKREKIGDILVEADSCRVIVIDEISEYISYNLLKIGRSKVVLEITDVDELTTPEQNSKEIKVTVASLRLDSIASAGFGISRSKIAELIKAERVNLNWETTDSLTKNVKEGDTISVRGKGRVVLETVGKITKKGRIGVILYRMQ